MITSPGPDPTKPMIGGSLRSSNHLVNIAATQKCITDQNMHYDAVWQLLGRARVIEPRLRLEHLARAHDLHAHHLGDLGGQLFGLREHEDVVDAPAAVRREEVRTHGDVVRRPTKGLLRPCGERRRLANLVQSTPYNAPYGARCSALGVRTR